MKRLVLATTVAVASALGSIPTASAAGRWNTSELGLKSVAHGPKVDKTSNKQLLMGMGHGVR
jgi:hypothetical protein